MAGYLCALRVARALGQTIGRSDAVSIPEPSELARRLTAVVLEHDAALARLDASALETGLALLASGDYAELLDNLRYKVLEGMLLPLPAVWELLHVAHGPFQQAHGRRATFIALVQRDDAAGGELLSRLETMLDHDRQRLVRFTAKFPGPLAVFEHEALMNELLLRYVAARAIDQVRWPGRGADAPLYELGRNDEPSSASRDQVGRSATVARSNLELLTWPELASELAAGRRTAVLPLGATEQHGPHLPFATDTWIADELAARFCARVPEAVRLPTLSFGCSSEHADFPGTLSLRATTLESILVDVVASLARHGFERLFVFSAHGGNYPALSDAMAKIESAGEPLQVIGFTDLAGLTAVLHRESAGFAVSPAASGHHAGEVETSIVCGLRPESVRRDRLEPGAFAPPGDAQSLFYPSLRDGAPSGTVGDPRGADALRAGRYLDAWVELLVATYQREKNVKYANGTKNE
jgi:creatinine amidohydrolase